jgi:hypothetical protein
MLAELVLQFSVLQFCSLERGGKKFKKKKGKTVFQGWAGSC